MNWMLDILEKFLIRKGYCFSRLDGSTPMSLRQSLVDDFNRSPSKRVFLISTRAGGLGLNLVSANRVVIFDPNWNPAQDLQAQDRSFRYGQKRHVMVFRFLAAGSLEELVYTRQVYKQQLSNIAVSGKFEKRYFEGVQDCKEYKGELFGICNLFRDLSDKLFTSEIIEVHKKHEQEYSSHSVKDLMKHDKDHSIQDQRTIECHSAKETNDVSFTNTSCEVAGAMENKTTFIDLGIVYVHRNEDVVNMGPGFQREDATSSFKHNTAVSSAVDIVDKNQMAMNVCGDRGASSSPSKTRKRREYEYGLIAQYVGMGELEFSKWVLDASTSEREQLLRDYYKRNNRRKHKS